MGQEMPFMGSSLDIQDIFIKLFLSEFLSDICNGQVLVESEVKIKEKPQAGIVLFSLFCILQNLMVIHTCPLNFLMQSYHMTMLTIFKLWGVGSIPFPTYT